MPPEFSGLSQILSEEIAGGYLLQLKFLAPVFRLCALARAGTAQQHETETPWCSWAGSINAYR